MRSSHFIFKSFGSFPSMMLTIVMFCNSESLCFMSITFPSSLHTFRPTFPHSRKIVYVSSPNFCIVRKRVVSTCIIFSCVLGYEGHYLRLEILLELRPLLLRKLLVDLEVSNRSGWFPLFPCFTVQFFADIVYEDSVELIFRLTKIFQTKAMFLNCLY